MSGRFVEQIVATPLGPLALWRAPTETEGPVVLCVVEPGAPIEPFLEFETAIDRLGDLQVLRAPHHLPVTAAVEAVIAAALPARPLVLLAAGAAALSVLAVRAANLRRIVALAPSSLDTDGEQALRALTASTDVLLGGDADRRDRARLSMHPRMRLHQAAAPGAALLGQAAHMVRDVLQEAVRRASTTPAPGAAELDEPLLEAAPITALRLAHWGPGGEAFAAAAIARNPAASVLVADPDGALPPGEAVDAIVLGQRPTPEVLQRLAAHLRPGGWMVARWMPRSAATPPFEGALASFGLRLLDPTDEAGTGVLRAQKREDAPPPALVVQYDAYAPFLMDIRTRLPMRALRGVPELRVAYYPRNARLAALERDRPKVAVLQRPADPDVDAWRAYMARAIVGGWVVVMEIDDHPELIAEAMRQPIAREQFAPIGCLHAVQTSTPALAEAFRPYNPFLKVLPNAVFELPAFPAQDRGPRVMYGAIGRGSFAAETARALAPALSAVPETEFEVIADRAVFEALPTDRKRFHGYLTYEAYLELMESCSISLSPAPARPLLATKSDAKFLDAARAGALTIGSPILYGAVIEHGVNGLVAESPEDFGRLLGEALAKPAWRRQMAKTAWDEMRERRMFAAQAPVWRDWYLELWARRDELNAALIQRLPGLAEAIAGLQR